MQIDYSMKTIEEIASRFNNLDASVPNLKLWALLEKIGQEGGIVFMKIDGERPSNRYTVGLSGGKMGDEFFRKDGDNLDQLLTELVAFYDLRVWH